MPGIHSQTREKFQSRSKALHRWYIPASQKEPFPTIKDHLDVSLVFYWWIKKRKEHVKPSQQQQER